MTVIQRFWAMIFPRRCPFCGRILPLGEIVCQGCERHLFRFEKPFLLSEDGKEFSCFVPYSYEKEVRRAVLDLKYHRKAENALVFARAAVKMMADSKYDAVVCVPDSRRYRRTSQERIARETAGLLGIPLIHPLRKDRGVPRQHDLTEDERKINVQHAYHPKNGAALNGASCLLIDDIVTTGSTLTACAAALFQAGAGSVALCAAAKTPRKDGKDGRFRIAGRQNVPFFRPDTEKITEK